MDVSDRQTILAPGDRLGCYEIDSFLGQGGFGVTYVARDTMLDLKVAIKEYLPERVAERELSGNVQPRSEQDIHLFERGLANFLKEARTLARFNHPNIVRVMSVFELHGTAYMVMEYERGHDLKVIFNRRERINESLLKTLVGPILDGLEEVHRHGFIHRDIKPANVLVRDNGTPVLLDFGSARLAVGQDTEAITAMVTVGFAPLEQYSGLDDQQGPWTDVYALGAVLYYAITGQAPPDSTLRAAAVLNQKSDPYLSLSPSPPPGYSRSFCRAIDWALQFRVSARPQSLNQWRSRLFNDEDESVDVTPTPLDPQGADRMDTIPTTEPIKPKSFRVTRPASADDPTVIRLRPPESDLEIPLEAVNRHDDTYEFEPLVGQFGDDNPKGGDKLTQGAGSRKSIKNKNYLYVGIATFVLIGAITLIGVRQWQPSVADKPLTTDSAAILAQPASLVESSPVMNASDEVKITEPDVDQNDKLVIAEELLALEAQAEREAKQAEADRLAKARAARLEADREVQRVEARRQARLQEQREAEITAERLRQAAASREAERQAEIRKAQERQAAIDLETERNAIKPVISSSDFSTVLSRFNALAKAIELRDSAAVKDITVQSDRKTAYFDYVFRTFDKVETALGSISGSRQDQTIRAKLTIKRMIRKNGDIAIPPDEFRNIPLYSVKETTWSAIHW